MLTTEIESRLAKFTAFGVAAVALLVTDRISLEPVNLGKMVLTVLLAGVCIGLTLTQLKNFLIEDRPLWALLFAFLLMCGISIIVSENPWEKGFYGAYGRNTGFLTYLAFGLLFCTSSLFRKIRSFESILLALFVTGFLNVVYGFLVLSGNDIFNWKNPYNRILGTFGNPNFIGAFLGIFITLCITLILSNKISIGLKLFALLQILLAAILIVKSGALQGVLVSMAGCLLAMYLFLRSRVNSRIVPWLFLISVAVGALVALAGILQRGPLAPFLYKPSVSLRGEYWRAGLNMAKENIWFGVGLDSYGTYFRQYRDLSATVLPGVNTTTDAAHNVFIDIFAGTGIVGLISYCGLIAIVLAKSVRTLKKSKSFDPVFISLFLCWSMYILQSVISINQVGLAIWGWVLGGCLVGYERMSASEVLQKPQSKKWVSFKQVKSNNAEPLRLPASVLLLSLATSILFFLVSLPPFLVDAQLRQALASKSFDRVLSNAYQWPRESYRTNFVLVKLAADGFDEKLVKLSYEATLKFPVDYSSWYAWYQINSNDPEKMKKIMAKLHTLDPYNPEFAPK